MSNQFTFYGIVFGISLIVIRIFASLIWKSIKPLALTDAIVLILSCISIGTAIELCLVIKKEGSVIIKDSQKVYILLGGIALLWVSAQSVYNIFKSDSETADERRR